MWWKLVLLALYLAVLFVLSRVLETVAWYEGGYLASRLLDPVSLSVKKLKTLLDQRGVSYAGVVEKQELTELMEASGEVSEGELEAATLADADITPESTNFTCGSHFYEEVEDTKDSVWVVQVVREPYDLFMRKNDWNAFVKRVTRFGVRTGIFDCSLDWRLCDRKKWFTSRLVLAVPQGYRAKDTVVLRDYMRSPKIRSVLDWVNTNLAARIKTIVTQDELASDWLSPAASSTTPAVRLLLVSTLLRPPLLLSALSVKFTGRVQIGTIYAHTPLGFHLTNKLNLTHDKPQYVAVTPEQTYVFGRRAGEYLNYAALALFLRTLHPEVNDMFLLSLLLVNASCVLELCVSRGSAFRRFARLVWTTAKWNLLLLGLWLPALAVFQLPCLSRVLETTLAALRTAGLTPTAAILRADWLSYLHHSAFLSYTFLAYAVAIAVIYHVTRDPNAPDDDTETNTASNLWNFQWDTLTSYFFRPMSALSVSPSSESGEPGGNDNRDLEMDVELLIARLAVPNFWLRPVISADYINELPVWTYAGPSVDSDFGSDTDAMSLQSDGEDARSDTESVCSVGSDTGGKRPFMFVCEKCRALQSQKENAGKSQQQLERERLESESACAKYLMDGDYKCSCALEHRPVKRSPRKQRNKVKERERISHEDYREGYSEMPTGMLPISECAICLEGYKYGTFLCGLPCGHSFHQHCIMNWLSRDNHCCPVCRWPAYKAKPCSLHLHAE